MVQGIKEWRAREKRNGLSKKPIILSILKEFVFVVKFQGNVNNTE